MKVRRNVRKAFTLVEILIVVVILGILAAIVVPQFTNAANEARNGNVQTQLSTIENQLELFRAKTGAYPTLAEMQLEPTSGVGIDWGILVDNDYLKTSATNPYTGGSTVAAVGAGTDWEYDPAEGVVTALGAP